jgi:hypothetical protein
MHSSLSFLLPVYVTLPRRVKSDRLLAILFSRRIAKRPGYAGDTGYVFSGTVTATFSGWAYLIACLRDVVGFDDWRPHDIRRSFVTQLAEQGVDETLLDLIINHRASGSRSGVKGVYQRSQRWAERVAALDAWNAYLDQQLGENVAPLGRQRG